MKSRNIAALFIGTIDLFDVSRLSHIRFIVRPQYLTVKIRCLKAFAVDTVHKLGIILILIITHYLVT